MHVLLLTILFIVFFFLFCHIHSLISNWINILCFNHTNCVQSTDYIRLIWMCWFICILFLSIFLGYAYMHETPFGFFSFPLLIRDFNRKLFMVQWQNTLWKRSKNAITIVFYRHDVYADQYPIYAHKYK